MQAEPIKLEGSVPIMWHYMHYVTSKWYTRLGKWF